RGVDDWARIDMNGKQKCLSTSADLDGYIGCCFYMLNVSSQGFQVRAHIFRRNVEGKIMCKYYYKRHSACDTAYTYPWYVLQCPTVRLHSRRINFEEGSDVPISFDRPCSKDPKTRRYVEVGDDECSACQEKKKKKEKKGKEKKAKEKENARKAT
ncbi:MAG: hypothetical protein Q9180_006033, partial [Flavoplaca navasiana]